MKDVFRYRLIEEIISEGRISRPNLLSKLNRRILQEDGNPISEGQLDKDIKFMRTSFAAQIITHRKRLNPGYEYVPNSPKIFTSQAAKANRENERKLNFAIDILQSKADLPLLRQGLMIINEVIGERLEEYGENIIMVEPSSSEVIGSKFIPELYNYIKSKQTIIVEYQKLGEQRPSRRTLSPYLLREYRGFWYLVGYNHDSEKGKPPVIVLALDRFKNISKGNVSFYKEKNFNPTSYFKHSLGVFHQFNQQPLLITFWASENATHFLEVRKLHSSQKSVRKMDLDGKKGMIYQINVFMSDEVVNLFLERGKGLKALSPPNFVKAVKERLNAIIQLYK